MTGHSFPVFLFRGFRSRSETRLYFAFPAGDFALAIFFSFASNALRGFRSWLAEYRQRNTVL